jgi:hypothetical protein
LPDSGELAGGFVQGLCAKGQVVHLGVLSDRMRAKECRRLAVRRRAGAADAAVGDSPEGPLKQPGESCLKPAKNQN